MADSQGELCTVGVTLALWCNRAGEDHHLEKGWRLLDTVFQKDLFSSEVTFFYFWKYFPVENVCSWLPKQFQQSNWTAVSAGMFLSEKNTTIALGQVIRKEVVRVTSSHMPGNPEMWLVPMCKLMFPARKLCSQQLHLHVLYFFSR